VGDLKKYANFQAADSIKDAANNPSGMAGAGMGLGVGAALGQAMAQAMPGGSPAAGGSTSQEDVYDKLEKLHGLVTKGVLTQEEFDAKKAELLKSIS